jgi:hypothetical protein
VIFVARTGQLERLIIARFKIVFEIYRQPQPGRRAGFAGFQDSVVKNQAITA